MFDYKKLTAIRPRLRIKSQITAPKFVIPDPQKHSINGISCPSFSLRLAENASFPSDTLEKLGEVSRKKRDFITGKPQKNLKFNPRFSNSNVNELQLTAGNRNSQVFRFVERFCFLTTFGPSGEYSVPIPWLLRLTRETL